MDETVIATKKITTVAELRELLCWVRDDMPVRDHIKRRTLAVTLVKTDQGEVLEVS